MLYTTQHFEIVYILHHLYIMYSNAKTLSDVTYLPAGSMDCVPTGDRPIKSGHFYQAGDNVICFLAYQLQRQFMSYNDFTYFPSFDL